MARLLRAPGGPVRLSRSHSFCKSWKHAHHPAFQPSTIEERGFPVPISPRADGRRAVRIQVDLPASQPGPRWRKRAQGTHSMRESTLTTAMTTGPHPAWFERLVPFQVSRGPRLQYQPMDVNGHDCCRASGPRLYVRHVPLRCALSDGFSQLVLPWSSKRFLPPPCPNAPLARAHGSSQRVNQKQPHP